MNYIWGTRKRLRVFKCICPEVRKELAERYGVDKYIGPIITNCPVHRPHTLKIAYFERSVWIGRRRYVWLSRSMRDKEKQYRN